MPLFKKKLGTSATNSPNNSPSRREGTGNQKAPGQQKNKFIPTQYQNGDLSHAANDDTEVPQISLLASDASPHRVECRRSCLSKSLQETLHTAASCEQLYAFLHSRRAHHLMQFWLDAESFRTAACSRLRVNSANALSSRGGISKIGDSQQTSDPPRTPQFSCDTPSTPPNTRKQNPHQSSPALCGLDTSSSQSNNPSSQSNNQMSSASANHHHQRTTSDASTCDKLMKSIQRDAVALYSKYISQDAPHALHISDDMRNHVIGQMCREDNEVDPLCFMPVQNFVLDQIENQYFADFIQSGYNFKDQVDILTSASSSKLKLEDVLFNQMSLFYFMEYVEKEGGMPLIELWLCLDNFKQNVISQQSDGSYDALEAQQDAMVIYDKYFSLQATQPIGFPDAIRFDVEINICREEGPSPHCFDVPRDLVLNSIEQKYFHSYVSSDVYYKYLGELINSAHTLTSPHHLMSSAAGSSRLARSGSESSEVSSVSSHSTLLGAAGPSSSVASAAGKKGPGRSHATAPHAHPPPHDMQIEADRFNPDALWRRAGERELSLGWMNEMGKFETKFEPEPDKKERGSLFGKAVKKFVSNKQEEKEKEEMAWQVAQMIISDITSVTTQQSDAASDCLSDVTTGGDRSKQDSP